MCHLSATYSSTRGGTGPYQTGLPLRRVLRSAASLWLIPVLGALLCGAQPPQGPTPGGPPAGGPPPGGFRPGAPRPDAAPAVPQKELTEQVAPGIVYKQRNISLGGQPVQLQYLEVDPDHPAINLLPVHALDRAAGKELTTSIAKRYGATAAINGGYFYVSGPLAGASTGIYRLNGKVISSGDKRSSLVFCEEIGGKERTTVASAGFRGNVRAADGHNATLAGMNRPRADNELVLYTSVLGPTTPPVAGFEVALDASDKVVSAGQGEGGNRIPLGGMVLSASGDPAEWLREHAAAGSTVKVDVRLDPLSPLGACKPGDMIGAGPRLITGGKIDVPDEGFNHATTRHPRTAFAVTADGKFLLLTLDGRQSTSAGMTLAELANQLQSMGAVEAINLDGGGSTTMVVNGVIRNSPSDRRERSVSDAILVFSVPDFDALDRLVTALGTDQIDAETLPRIREAAATARKSGNTQPLVRLVHDAENRGITPAAARVLTEALGGLRK